MANVLGSKKLYRVPEEGMIKGYVPVWPIILIFQYGWFA